MEDISSFCLRFEFLFDPDFRCLDSRSNLGENCTTVGSVQKNFLSTVVESLAISPKSVGNLPNCKASVDSLKALAIIVRNPENGPIVSSLQIPVVVIQNAIVVLEYISQTENNENVDCYMWYLHGCLYFIECLYDPHFSWRKKSRSLKGSDGMVTYFLKTPPITAELMPFITDLLSTYHKVVDSAVTERAVHVLGGVMSGNLNNAVNVVSLQTVHTVLSLGKQIISTGSCSDVTLLRAVLKCFGFLVTVLRTLRPDQRLVDMHSTLTEFFNVIGAFSSQPVSSQNLAVVFESLDYFLDNDDKCAMQLECISAGAFESLLIVAAAMENPITSGADDNRDDLLMAVVLAMCKLLRNCQTATDIFKGKNGFGVLNNLLLSHPSVAFETVKAIVGSFVNGAGEIITPQLTPIFIRWSEVLVEDNAKRWILVSLHDLAHVSLLNIFKMHSAGAAEAICDVIRRRESQLILAVINDLFRLLTSLCVYSLPPTVCRHLIRLLNEGTFVNRDLINRHVMQIFMAASEPQTSMLPSNFFVFAKSSDQLIVPGVRSWPGSGLSIHLALRLDRVTDDFYVDANGLKHRQLYSFIVNNYTGFDAFFTQDLSLVVAVATKKEYQTVVVKDGPFADGKWHTVTVCHSVSKIPFQSGQTMVYIDGVVMVSASMKMPNISEPFCYCCIGSGEYQQVETNVSTSYPTSLAKKLHQSNPVRFSDGGGSSPSAVCSIPPGLQRDYWGSAASIGGNISGICILSYLQGNLVKTLHNQGFVLDTFPEDSELKSKLVVHYCSKRAWEKSTIFDLSPARSLDGYVSAFINSVRNMKNSISSIGGLPVVFALIDQLRVGNGMDQTANSSNVRIADVLNLVNFLVRDCDQLRETFGDKERGMAVLGYLLRKSPAKLIDTHALMAVQSLVEYLRKVAHQHGGDRRLLEDCYRHVLLDFSIWAKTEFTVRVGHVQYVATLIKEDRKFFRKHFGVRFFLDVLRLYHCCLPAADLDSFPLNTADLTVVRNALVQIVKFLVARDISYKEMMGLLQFLFCCSENTMVDLVLKLMRSLVESPLCREQFCLIMFEEGMGDLMYTFLLSKQSGSDELKLRVLGFISLLLQTETVAEKNKGRLKLHGVGFSGLFHLMKGQVLTAEVALLLVKLVMISDRSVKTGENWPLDNNSRTDEAFADLVSLLFLLQDSSVKTRLEVCLSLRSILYTKADAPSRMAKCLCWQEAILGLLISPNSRNFEELPSFTTSVKSSSFISSTSVAQSVLETSLQPSLMSGAGSVETSLEISDANSLFKDYSEMLSWYATSETKTLNSPPHFVPVGAAILNPTSLMITTADEPTYLESSQRFTVSRDGSYSEAYVHTSPHGSASNFSSFEQPASLNSAESRSTICGNSETESLSKKQFETSSQSELDNLDNSGLSPWSAATISSVADRSSRSSGTNSPTSFTPKIYDDPNYFDLTVEQARQEEERRETRRTGLGMTSTASSCAQDDLVQQSTSAKGESDENKLVNVCLDVINCIMRTGFSIKEDKQLWKVKSLVFAALNMLSCQHQLVISHTEIHRRLLECCLQSAYMDAKRQGQSAVSVREVTLELMKWVYDFYASSIVQEMQGRFSRLLLELIENLVKYSSGSTIGVEDENLTYFVLCTFCCYIAHCEDTEVSSLAAAKLNDFLHLNRLPPEAVAYVLLKIDKILTESLATNNSLQYGHLVPLIKYICTEFEVQLEVGLYLPSVSEGSNLQLQNLFQEFHRHARADDWRDFILKKVSVMASRYSTVLASRWKSWFNVFWTECYEQLLMVGKHTRMRAVGEGQLRFQAQILNPFRDQVDKENVRFTGVYLGLKANMKAYESLWKRLLGELQNERGPWRKETSGSREPQRWKLSPSENFSRMRLKLEPNAEFDDHKGASNLRDNVAEPEASGSSQENVVTKIKVARRNNVTSDGDALRDEDLELILKKREGEVNVPEEVMSKEEKTVLTEDCVFVKITDVIPGQFTLTNRTIKFLELSTGGLTRDAPGSHSFSVSLLDLREIHLRRYNLRRSAIEFFLVDQTNFFLNFTSPMRNKIYGKIVAQRPSNLINYDVRSPVELLKASGMTQKWIDREISNFDYLMHLNTMAGRTYNDLSQYPVFPWVLKDYDSEELNLSDPETFRDLRCPIGVINPSHVAEVKAKYEQFEDPSGTIPKFHYGTHYSNAAGVIHYLIRVEPFTSLHVQLQSGRFDVADRLFHSVPRTWKTLMDSPNDVKELIPEFFYLPDFLINSNDFDLGKLQVTKERVTDVLLPPWAKSPEDFIEKHRRALESDYVSQHLNDWIDLIFGYKQQGAAAVQALNVFYYCSYEGNVDLDSITDPAERKALEGMIANFGQTPCQLLKEAHPRRLMQDEIYAKMLRLDSSCLNVFNNLRMCKTFAMQVHNEKESVVLINVPRNQPKNFMQQGMNDMLVTLTRNGHLGLNSWLPYDRKGKCTFAFDRDAGIGNAKTQKQLEIGIAKFVDSNLFAVSHDGKLLFVCGYWDYSFKVFSLGKVSPPVSIKRHSDVVTCCTLDTCGSHLMTGSADLTCLIWRIVYQGGFCKHLDKTSVQCLYGHFAPVTCVALRVELDLAVSGSQDGSVLVHTIKQGLMLYNLQSTVPHNCDSFKALHLATSYQGRIIVTVEENYAADREKNYSLHVYSVNGKSLCRDTLAVEPIGLQTDSEHIVTAHSNGLVSIRSLNRLDTLLTIPLRVGLCCVSVVPTSSHILCGTTDGRLIVISAEKSASQFY